MNYLKVMVLRYQMEQYQLIVKQMEDYILPIRWKSSGAIDTTGIKLVGSDTSWRRDSWSDLYIY